MTEKSPIINSPYEEPKEHWIVFEDQPPVLEQSRRPAMYMPTLNGPEEPIGVVEAVRKELKTWREAALNGEGGVSRTSMGLLQHWHREGREHPLFFAQTEAAESIIFLSEAREDYLQGISVPFDQPSKEAQKAGIKAFRRYCCKMATGSGKTTVMAMLAAWSILNKVSNPKTKKYSDAVLIVCPNVTIRERLRELDPNLGEASIYRTADLVPESQMNNLRQGKLMATNWHLFERQAASSRGSRGKVLRTGTRETVREQIRIGKKNTVMRGKRYVTSDEYKSRVLWSDYRIISEKYDSDGKLVSAIVDTEKYVESEEALIRRVVSKHFGKKKHVLVINDEAHHAYRINSDASEVDTDIIDEDGAVAFRHEATVWVNGLDSLHKIRGINFCIDFSATPFYLLASGPEANKVFPWTVSDFGLEDAIESGLVKIPMIAVKDTSTERIPGYLNIWEWVHKMIKEKKPSIKAKNITPTLILEHAHTPIAIIANQWNRDFLDWKENEQTSRPPVFIVVCKGIPLAKAIYKWFAEDKRSAIIPRLNIPALRNTGGSNHTIRVDSKISEEISSGSKTDEALWMRWILNTVGKSEWPSDKHGNSIYPKEFEELAIKLKRPLHPPGRDVRCIVSVSMLTEGWDCNTVTHIIGLRPFMSQLLCEQVIGRGLRRRDYRPVLTEKNTLLMKEETATVFGVPYKLPHRDPSGTSREDAERYHIHALPERKEFQICFPRVERYQQAISTKLRLELDLAAEITLDPSNIPPSVITMPGIASNEKRPSIHGPGKLSTSDLSEYRAATRVQKRLFELATDLLPHFEQGDNVNVRTQLFPQLQRIAQEYYDNKILVISPNEKKDAFLAPYYGMMVEQLIGSIMPVTSLNPPELPVLDRYNNYGSTKDVDYFTYIKPFYIKKSHVNAIVPDSALEINAAIQLEKHPSVCSYVKNSGLNFAIPYQCDRVTHDYFPDFIVCFGKKTNRCYGIVEMKGYNDPKVNHKKAAAIRWCKAVNAAGKFGQWEYSLARSVAELKIYLDGQVQVNEEKIEQSICVDVLKEDD